MAFQQVLLILVNQNEIVHVSDVVPDMQLFLDKMVQRIKNADSGNLDHLAAGVKPHCSVVLPVQHANCLPVCPSVDHLPEAVLHNLVRHVGIISLNVALEHVTLCAVLSVVTLQKAFQPFSRQIRPFALLAGHVIVDKAAADSWIQDVIVQASLKHSIPEVNAYHVPLFGIINLEFSGLSLLVASILKLAPQNQVFLDIVQKMMRWRILPNHTLDTFQGALAQRVKACYLLERIVPRRVLGVYRPTILREDRTISFVLFSVNSHGIRLLASDRKCTELIARPFDFQSGAIRGETIRVAGVVVDIARRIHIPRIIRIATISTPQTHVLRSAYSQNVKVVSKVHPHRGPHNAYNHRRSSRQRDPLRS